MNCLNDLKKPTRRVLLQGLLTAYTASLIPFALAETVDTPEQGAFVALSAIIAGRQSLDPVLANKTPVFRRQPKSCWC